MAHVIVLFNLKEGADRGAYEEWARTRDLPTVNALPSVNSFRVFAAAGLLGGGESPYAFVEVLDVKDMDGLLADISTDSMQSIASEFTQFADNPTFIVVDELAG